MVFFLCLPSLKKKRHKEMEQRNNSQANTNHNGIDDREEASNTVTENPAKRRRENESAESGDIMAMTISTSPPTDASNNNSNNNVVNIKIADAVLSLAASNTTTNTSTAPSSAAHAYTQQATTHPANFRALRTLNCVRLDNVVGAGTFGIVFKAEDIDTGDTVALKKIKFEMKDEKKMMEGFPLTVRTLLSIIYRIYISMTFIGLIIGNSRD